MTNRPCGRAGCPFAPKYSHAYCSQPCEIWWAYYVLVREAETAEWVDVLAEQLMFWQVVLDSREHPDEAPMAPESLSVGGA